MNQSVQITTTESLQGIEIESYLGAINSQMVVGMNLFKDFFSSWTDVFGGKSSSYNDTIARLYDTVSAEMQQKTARLGGNYILGFRIDLEEISGQGKSMMMITSVGTAAKVKISEKQQSFSNGSLTAQELNLQIVKKKLVQEVEEQKNIISINEDKWMFIVENDVHEVREKLLSLYLQSTTDRPVVKPKIIEYFSSIDTDKAIETLYGCLHQRSTYDEYIIELVGECNLMDLDRVTDIICKKDAVGLKLLKTDKRIYTPKDLDKMEALPSTIKNSFPDISTKGTKKKTFGGEIEVWICGACETKNDLQNSTCSKCGKDQYGILDPEINIHELLEELNLKISVLKEYFGKSTE